ncbi:hypothetical protein CC1G_13017 [Coprinopsis cinerea okayama7|uniref:Uncharacterized protein n=1 Tax=Coprinopsis cinerea (strain Okayama-7 / 130 / ATCC MYA-4618 / FGSC 9003) TaxID=240176 RepID=A8N415_COPC7|nr:hypothetical protein CC1G_13017 [Coprinopsis cinerea okayama7\|eukprot:XP_001829610.2 hypothetical protein CC1G_13017 [Coprinopsis cinerea okayama7\
MGRRLLYKTEEERKEAAKRASQRYYSRHKQDINLGRRTKYRELHPNRLVPSAAPLTTPLQFTIFYRLEQQMEDVRLREEREEFNARDPETWLKRARGLAARFNAHVNSAPRLFLDNLCQQLTDPTHTMAEQSRAITSLRTAQEQSSRFHKSSLRNQAIVWEVGGACPQWREVVELSTPITNFHQSIEEIETLHSALGPLQLRQEWSQGALHFQNVWPAST